MHRPHTEAVRKLDSTAIGMDFILTWVIYSTLLSCLLIYLQRLEAPCLAHIPQDTQASPSPSGHALMASATLLHHHPHATGHEQDRNTRWNLPESGVERLLELSDRLPLDGEVTPVQMWNHIRRHPQFIRLKAEDLEGLKIALMQHVKCYGYRTSIMKKGALTNIA